MKRLLPAFLIAMLTHLLVFVADDSWLKPKTQKAPKMDVITLRLVAHAPSNPTIHQLPPSPPSLPPMPKPAAKPKPMNKAKPAAKPKVFTKPKNKTPKAIAPKKTAKKAPQPISSPPSPQRPEANTVKPERPKSILVDDPSTSNQTSNPGPQVNATIVEAVPRYNRNPPPKYPKIARRRGYEGTVLLEVFVTENGHVGDLRILRSSGFAQLDTSARKSVQKWHFEPGRKGDRPVAMWVRVPVDFQLN